MYKMMYTLKGCWSHEIMGPQITPLAVFDTRVLAEDYFVNSQKAGIIKRNEEPFIKESLLHGFTHSVISPVPVPDPQLPLNPSLKRPRWRKDDTEEIIEDLLDFEYFSEF